MPVTDHIRNKLSQVSHRPGVYLMKDRFGTVIYVGKARDLRRRVSQYFQSSRRMGWDLKFNALVDAIHDFDTTLAVYVGSGVSSLTLMASNDDDRAGGTLTSAVTFTAVAGTTYRIAVDGYNAAAGTIVLNII